jgi:hypothetical protein
MPHYCIVEGLEVNRSAPDGPMAIASTIIVVQADEATTTKTA